MTGQIPHARASRRSALIIWGGIVLSVGVYALVIEMIGKQHEPFSGLSPSLVGLLTVFPRAEAWSDAGRRA